MLSWERPPVTRLHREHVFDASWWRTMRNPFYALAVRYYSWQLRRHNRKNI